MASSPNKFLQVIDKIWALQKNQHLDINIIHLACDMVMGSLEFVFQMINAQMILLAVSFHKLFCAGIEHLNM